MKRTEIDSILKQPQFGTTVKVMGWVRSFRANRFIALYDGSSFNTLQVVVPDGYWDEKYGEDFLKKISFHSCIAVTGQLVESQGAGQAVDLMAENIELLGGNNPEEYVLQPKHMTMEYLREKAHFRMRTQTFSAVFRIRHAVAFAVHKYFNDRGYYYMHTPIITGSDAEGAGEMFRVSTLSPENPPLHNDKVDKIAEKFYNNIIEVLPAIGMTLEEINNKISSAVIGLDLKKLVTATESEIKDFIKNDGFQKLNYFIYDKLFVQLKNLSENKLFSIHQDDKGRKIAFLPAELIKDLGYGFQEDKPTTSYYTKEKGLRDKDFRFLALTFYNFKVIHEYNQFSNEFKLDVKKDFFTKSTNLTVSGQLQGEIAALALGKIYTFGPTFRAEKSYTPRHLAEFWMIEPEVAFFDIHDNMDLAEDFVKYLINHILENYPDDLAFLDKRIKDAEKNMKQEERRPMGLVEMLRFVVDNSFERITYTEAVDILRNSNPYKKGKFQFPVEWGSDLQSEHERYLVEKHFQKPVVVRDYPKVIKAFYMRENDPDSNRDEPGKETVAAMDILFPYIGEVIGGSQREERYEKLLNRIHAQGIHEEELWWYLELRKFGGCPHAGFGLGFERMVQFITGMGNIRDVIPFPRAAGSAEF